MVVKFRNTICPPPPQLSLHRRAALSRNSNGTCSVCSRKNPKSSLYCEMSMGKMEVSMEVHQQSTIIKKISMGDVEEVCFKPCEERGEIDLYMLSPFLGLLSKPFPLKPI
jgi:hypothetical protein